MTNAKKDNNSVPVFLGISNADGSTILPLKVNPINHAIVADDGSGGTDLSGSNALKDDNGVNTALGVALDDGVTTVPIYINSSTGGLLINKT